ncbi:ATP-binding protein [Nonomuraea sp. NPDC050536]|uniref:ATP-binding protein n=1 Tax=Nonomuraea sp. NPDC050536 TaxID=3364366 RepID=UPI0037C8A0F1
MTSPALCATFGHGRITPMRRSVTEYAARHGLSGRRLEDFVLAVNEIATNAVLHGGGCGRLRLWSQGGRLWCEVTDDGPGLPPGWLGASRRPSCHQDGGRGLWLARLLCRHLVIVSSPRGTHITFTSPD